ncbi:2-dehydro-3-deoxyphosphooctonate aldolase [Bacillus coahuilensis m2-6]|uniref:3-deoxy-8-phosphooctulonate synthase n=1 Tax=Bacillus coahuilensis TaxID=408580 RepID=UPI0007501AE2|nr:3-deoxy-8-phosphooctulonate synthase [Bacillus coahuilensis]KUP05559.1 2-dehydro-3-deoxyphosphooctonate aldolase [Bacillus coahuilensis m2-6]
MNKIIIRDDIALGNDLPFVLFGGPCVIEGRDRTMFIAEKIKEITTKLNIPYVFKASFDKANRSSSSSYRGKGIEDGLEVLAEIKNTYDVPIITDIHESYQAKKVAEVADVLQIPAFLCRQTDLLLAAGESGAVVNVKKGQFMAPWDMGNVVNKLKETGNERIALTERGTTFGYNNLVVDMRSLEIMKNEAPVIFDATHSVQIPGGNGTSSGGNREFVSPLARAATSIGVAGLFMEIHDNPEEALSDGPNMIPLNQLEELLKKLKAFDQLNKEL